MTQTPLFEFSPRPYSALSEPLPPELEPYRVYTSRDNQPGATLEMVVYKLRDNLGAIFTKRTEYTPDGPKTRKYLTLMAWTGTRWVHMARRYTRGLRDLRDLSRDFWGQRDPQYRPRPLEEFPDNYTYVYF